MPQYNIVHIEIPTRDQKESGKFYGELFGWKIMSMPEMDYTMWEPEKSPGGGFSPLTETKVGEVLIYVASTDIETDLKRAAALGGKIVMLKTEIPNAGWFGLFTDPTGNRIALYTDKKP